MYDFKVGRSLVSLVRLVRLLAPTLATVPLTASDVKTLRHVVGIGQPIAEGTRKQHVNRSQLIVVRATSALTLAERLALST